MSAGARSSILQGHNFIALFAHLKKIEVEAHQKNRGKPESNRQPQVQACNVLTTGLFYFLYIP